MIFDNGRQFDTNKLHDYLSQYYCQAWFTAITHPQTNSPAEVANKVILHGLQKTFDNANGKCAEELHCILWLIQTIEKVVMGEPLFMSAHGFKAVLLVEVATHTH